MEPRIVFLKPKSIENIHQHKGSTLVYVNPHMVSSGGCEFQLNNAGAITTRIEVGSGNGRGNGALDEGKSFPRKCTTLD